MKTISVISAELRQSNPELGNPTAHDLNNMLLVKGLICIVKDGKAPTPLGQSKGIQKRVDKDDMGKRYCIPVYNEEAAQYVKTRAIEYYSVHAPQAAVPGPVPPAATPLILNPEYSFSRKDHEDIQSRNRDCLVLLEGPYAYWTYFHDARVIGRVMDWPTHVNKQNSPGIAFPKDRLDSVLQALDHAYVKWIVCHPYGEQRSMFESIPSNIEPDDEDVDVVEIGSYVRVLINGITEKSFLLRDSNIAPAVVQVTGTGMVVFTDFPILEEDSITVDSPAGRALLGQNVGNTITVPIEGTGAINTYQILEIK